MEVDDYDLGLSRIVLASPGKLVSVIFRRFWGVMVGSAKADANEGSDAWLFGEGWISGMKIRGWIV